MSRQQDREFCKIAIQTGLVSEEDAKRCLAYANKIEAAGQPRPRVGTVFVKAKLLGQQDARRVYAALQKRQGQSAPAARSPSRWRESADHRSQLRERRRPASRGERVSPAAMAMSVISLVALIIMIGVIAVLFYGASGSSEPEVVAKPKTTADAPKEPEKKPDEVADAHPINPEQLKQLTLELNQTILDAKSFVRDDLYGRALTQLTDFDERHTLYLQRDGCEDLRKNLTQQIGIVRERIGQEYDDAIAQARELAASGESDRALSVLEVLSDRVDEETAAKIEVEVQQIQGN